MQKLIIQTKYTTSLPKSISSILVPFLMGDPLEGELMDSLGIESWGRLPTKAGELVTYLIGDRSVTLLGIGEALYGVKLSQAIRKPLYDSLCQSEEPVVLYLSYLDAMTTITDIAVGVGMANYHPAQFKSENTTAKVKNLIVVGPDKGKSHFTKGEHISNAIISVMRLVDTPANIKTPDYLVQHAQGLAKKHKSLALKVLDEVDLAEQGYGAIMAVGQGSDFPPRLIELTYEPSRYNRTIAFVGKGITFDTGGISIKPSNNMHYMKSDMGGAGVVLGMMEVIASLKLPFKVIGVVPTAENAVDAASIKPGDVIYSYSGKSIEIIDTDAEGRLILADALYHTVTKFQPDYMIDLATLTGSIVRALGSEAAGLFTTNESLSQELVKAGLETGERVWPMPMYDEYKDHLHSDVADVANLGSRPVAGAIAAAKFLEVFTDNHSNWAHLDIAGMSFDSNAFSKSKSATGYGIRLLLQWLEALK